MIKVYYISGSKIGHGAGISVNRGRWADLLYTEAKDRIDVSEMTVCVPIAKVIRSSRWGKIGKNMKNAVGRVRESYGEQ